ncbi:MAG: hypothetical protein EBX35_12365, partial [Planctomycetia bacterium]|nr:hypothetical protein [Planctomycetia bacterium]
MHRKAVWNRPETVSPHLSKPFRLPMSNSHPASAEGLVKSIRQIGLELAFVDPIAENSVEPLRSLVSSLEAKIGEDGPAPIRAAVAAARGWLGEGAAADGTLTAHSIA